MSCPVSNLIPGCRASDSRDRMRHTAETEAIRNGDRSSRRRGCQRQCGCGEASVFGGSCQELHQARNIARLPRRARRSLACVGGISAEIATQVSSAGRSCRTAELSARPGVNPRPRRALRLACWNTRAIKGRFSFLRCCLSSACTIVVQFGARRPFSHNLLLNRSDCGAFSTSLNSTAFRPSEPDTNCLPRAGSDALRKTSVGATEIVSVVPSWLPLLPVHHPRGYKSPCGAA